METEANLIKQKLVKEDIIENLKSYSVHVKLGKKVLVQLTLLNKIDKQIRECTKHHTSKEKFQELVISLS